MILAKRSMHPRVSALPYILINLYVDIFTANYFILYCKYFIMHILLSYLINPSSLDL